MKQIALTKPILLPLFQHGLAKMPMEKLSPMDVFYGATTPPPVTHCGALSMWCAPVQPMAGLGGSALRLLCPMTLLVGALRGIAVSGAAFSASFGFIGTVIEVVGVGISSVVGVFLPQ